MKAQAQGPIAESSFIRPAWNRCPKLLRRRPVRHVLAARLNHPAAIATVTGEADEVTATVAVVAPEAVVRAAN